MSASSYMIPFNYAWDLWAVAGVLVRAGIISDVISDWLDVVAHCRFETLF